MTVQSCMECIPINEKTTTNRINKAKLKQEGFRRKLRLVSFFQNEERAFDCNKKIRPKSTFNVKNKDIIIETYLSSLKEKLLDIGIPKDKFNILVKKRGMSCIF